MRFIILFLCCFGLGCCGDPARLDGKILQDREGNFYKAEAHFGHTYFIEPHEPVSADDFLEKK